MLPQLLELLPGHISGAMYWTIGAVVVVVILFSVSKSPKRPNLDHIPTAGSSTWFGSWWAGAKFLFNANQVIQKGYEQYKGGTFKVSTFYDWMVVVSGRQHFDEFHRFREDELSILEAMGETMKADYTLGHDTFYNPYHVPIISSKLTRNLGVMYPDIRDEIVTAFEEILSLEGREWKSVPALKTVQQVVTRASNRAFVGLPLCRDPDWIDLNIRYTVDVMLGAGMITLFPEFMAPLVARFMTNVPKSIRRGVKLLTPIIEARRKRVDEYGGSWDESPNDFLSWLLQGSEGSRREVDNITSRMLAVNFAAVHTSSNSFTHALYDLATNPQYLPILREEVETIIKEEGWSKASIAKMHKVDSFIKESQRISAMAYVIMVRKAMKDVTFSDGTVIPKGAFTVMASQSVHLDKEYYHKPEVFDPFRFANMRKEDDVGTTKHAFSTTSPEYLVFGHGKHACPGRFFAANALVTMFAHVLISYDIQLEGSETRPRDFVIGTSITANTSARMKFRKRDL